MESTFSEKSRKIFSSFEIATFTSNINIAVEMTLIFNFQQESI